MARRRTSIPVGHTLNLPTTRPSHLEYLRDREHAEEMWILLERASTATHGVTTIETAQA